MTRKTFTLFDPALLRPAVLDAFRKLAPQVQWRNPVMFVVYVGAILTTGLWLHALGGHGEAPAPLPSFAASAALDKAQAAVPGGRAESLSRVTAQGGGAAWAVTVVGQDGVRHLVTVDGTDGQLTSNTVADGSEG